MTDATARVIREGVIAGILGYLAVVVLFAVVNVIQGDPLFYTPLVLGSALLGGALDQPGPYGPILAYNGLHLLVALALGLICAWLARRAEESRFLGLGLAFALLAIGGWVPLVFGMISVEILHALSWVQVVGGSLAGAAATLGYLAWSHGKLVGDLFRTAES